MEYDLETVRNQGYQIINDYDRDEQTLYLNTDPNIDKELDDEYYSTCIITDPEIKKIMLDESDDNGIYTPSKKFFDDYKIAYFYNKISMIKNLYDSEIIPAIKSLQTPNEYGHNKAMNLLTPGYITGDEIGIISTMESWKRSVSYDFAILSINGMFFHYLASIIDKSFFNFAARYGFKDDFCNRSKLIKFWKQKFNVNINKIYTYRYYKEMISVWNFLKHNSKSSFKKVKEYFPNLMQTNNWDNSDFYFHHISITPQYIKRTLKRIKQFFRSLVKKTFKEDFKRAMWDHNGYFGSQINDIVNPLGLPDYL